MTKKERSKLQHLMFLVEKFKWENKPTIEYSLDLERILCIGYNMMPDDDYTQLQNIIKDSVKKETKTVEVLH